MTDMYFDDKSGTADSQSVAVTEANVDPPKKENPFPKAMITVTEEKKKDFISWIDWWLLSMEGSIQAKITQWADEEKDYRAKSLGPQTLPYQGACGDVVPAIAMAVDPIHARLDTGIFKSDPVFRVKGLKKSVLKYTNSVERFIDFYQKHKLKLRQVASPRILECTKHGTMVFKTIYDREQYKVKTYDKAWNVVTKEVTRFAGPRIRGISLNDFWFPAYHQFLEDCPIVAERQRVVYDDLAIAEQSGKLVDCAKIKDFLSNDRTVLEEERARSTNLQDAGPWLARQIEIFEIWCRYDIDGDGTPERLVLTYHRPTQTILQLRYNYYFHQRYPYTVIPYSVTNDSLYGIGIAEMVRPFQDMLTKWQRMATDNAYLANIRMFIARKDSGIEEVPKLYAGRTFFVDKPKEDFISFAAAEVYNSTLTERQNLFGLSEKRTGVSDYLTGRESPIVGSRATATSTMALIQEGTRRVEEVLENVRIGFAEMIEMCMYIWMQFGTDSLEDIAFGDDQVAADVKDFFDSIGPENVNGGIAIDLSATDAANNRSAQQQMQLSIIQVMMQYLEKLLAAGAQALEAQQSMPIYAAMIGEVMTAARKMFKDLLAKYDIPNPDDYLPDLEKFLGGTQQGGAGGTIPPDTGPLVAPGVQVSPAAHPSIVGSISSLAGGL